MASILERLLADMLNLKLGPIAAITYDSRMR